MMLQSHIHVHDTRTHTHTNAHTHMHIHMHTHTCTHTRTQTPDSLVFTCCHSGPSTGDHRQTETVSASITEEIPYGKVKEGSQALVHQLFSIFLMQSPQNANFMLIGPCMMPQSHIHVHDTHTHTHTHAHTHIRFVIIRMQLKY